MPSESVDGIERSIIFENNLIDPEERFKATLVARFLTVFERRCDRTVTYAKRTVDENHRRIRIEVKATPNVCN